MTFKLSTLKCVANKLWNEPVPYLGSEWKACFILYQLITGISSQCLDSLYSTSMLHLLTSFLTLPISNYSETFRNNLPWCESLNSQLKSLGVINIQRTSYGIHIYSSLICSTAGLWIMERKFEFPPKSISVWQPSHSYFSNAFLRFYLLLVLKAYLVAFFGNKRRRPMSLSYKNDLCPSLFYAAREMLEEQSKITK